MISTARSTAKPKMLVETASPAERQLYVLLVDDDERYLKLCERYLMRSNESKFHVHTAISLSMAVELYTEFNYDCLVVDYLLPDGTGTDLIDILSRDISKSTPPAIITTADGGEDAATEAIRAGAADYLSKRNLNSESLSRCIHNAVDKFRLSESLKARNAELLNANDRLRRNRKEIMHFYHTVSHEVKTPLAAAREFISLVKDGAQGMVTVGQNQLLQHAIESCDQINKQFTELLDLTRLESGKLELKRAATPASTLTTRSVASVSEIARSKKVRIQQLGVLDIDVMADPDRIVQVLSNLLHNAVKFSNDDSEVVLRTRICESGDQLEFRVEDSGCGIAEDELNSVFDRLYQCEHQRPQPSACGLGLGLAIAKDIVELHDSILGLTSELNTGSSFHFQLPIVAERI